MGLRDVILGRPTATPAPVEAAGVSSVIGNYRSQSITNLALLTVTRQEAMSVPAVARSRNLIANTIGAMPLDYYVRDESTGRSRKLDRLPWMRQPEPATPRQTTIAYLVDSMLFFGRGYLRVLDVYEEDGRPKTFEWIDPAFVTFDVDAVTGRITRYYINLNPVPNVGRGSLIVFPGPDEGLLARGGRTIRTAVDLEIAARNFAEAPTPAVTLKNSGVDLPGEQVQQLLAAWRDGRRNSSVSYLASALDIETHGFSPADLTLVDARRFQVQELSRLVGIPAWYIAADAGSSMTYNNVANSRRDLVDFSLAPFAHAIEQRLSMEDVTRRGHHVAFSFDDYLRASPIELAQFYSVLVGQGIVAPEDAADQLDLRPGGPTG